MNEKYQAMVKWCNENSGFLSFIALIITILTLVFGNKVIGIFLLILLLVAGVWHFAGDDLKKKNNVIVGIITVLAFVTLIYQSILWYYFADPKILNLAKGFTLKFEDRFEGGNLASNSNYRWWNKDDKVVNSESGHLTLKTSSAVTHVYPIFQDVRGIAKDYIVFSSFNVPEGARVSIQFMNTKGINSNEYLGFHLQECVLNIFSGKTTNGNAYKKGFGSYLYERKPIGPPNFQARDLSAGVYHMLVSVTGNSYSCYVQKEGDSDYATVVKDQVLKYSNLAGPALSRMTDGAGSFPELLDYRLYLKD